MRLVLFIKLVSEYVKGILIKTEYRFQLLKLPIKISSVDQI